jgi:probable addiction module antidote protein
MLEDNLRDNPTAIAHYLNEIFEKNEIAGILEALKVVMRAQNVLALAESTGLRRDGLYKSFNGTKDTQISRLLLLFQGLGVRIEVRALSPQTRPPRPKLGRPPSSSSRRARQEAKRTSKSLRVPRANSALGRVSRA